MDEPRRKLTPDEITEEINELARSGQGADKRWALNILRPQTGNHLALAPIHSADEVVDRLSRLMKPAGQEASRLAYRRAFPHDGADGIKKYAEVRIGDIPPELMDVVRKIVSVRTFYKMFPSHKRSGQPKGYPRNRGIEIQRDWLRRLAAQILMDREQESINQAIQQEGKDAESKEAS